MLSFTTNTLFQNNCVNCTMEAKEHLMWKERKIKGTIDLTVKKEIHVHVETNNKN